MSVLKQFLFLIIIYALCLNIGRVQNTARFDKTIFLSDKILNGNLSQIRSRPALSGAIKNTYTCTSLLGIARETGQIYYEYDWSRRLKPIRNLHKTLSDHFIINTK